MLLKKIRVICKKATSPNLYYLALTLPLLISCGVSRTIKDIALVTEKNISIPERIQISDSSFSIGSSFISKNKQGLWEMYVEGTPLEIGMITGSLTQELYQNQEAIFFSKIEEIIPSKTSQFLLRKFLAWYNRKMYQYIPQEYKTEIYGVSHFASANYNYIAPPYVRALYLHGAHDIGHALQDLALVGCSSFAVWGTKTEDGGLLVGRNFDFYAGDDFSQEKIVAFIKPTNGHPFMSVTWGGMIGVVSGMNTQGLTVTINAGKSKIPLVAKTPISVVAREILQYASTIDEAVAIAKQREVFVSEAIFISSAKDNKAAIIEVSPKHFGVYEVPNSTQLICTNHFMSKPYLEDKRNNKHIIQSHSAYRFQRMEELISAKKKITPNDAVAVLRNKEGLQDQSIGYGNEKALNQLLAHHGIVFQPEKLLVWVSSNPYQLGEFVAYDLSHVFGGMVKENLSEKDLTIMKDPFLNTQAYANYEANRILEKEIEIAINEEAFISEEKISNFKNNNPDYWKTYYLTGLYYYNTRQYQKAITDFETALQKEITTLPNVEECKKLLKKSKRKAR
ncbi:MAG: acyl-CoA--6-aminopenicillanic acid acyl-transferase [Flavobacteriaceae bacterium]|nr:acyl-CoA--6-aminopenicillanic acid acyl-transferase [Flavobacteriaceae bacterium]